MITNTIRFVASSVLLSLAFTASAQNGVSIAQSLAATSANCHGTNGRLPANKRCRHLLVDQRNGFANKSRHFRNYARPSTVMQQIVRGYSDQEIELIANYLAKNGG